MSNIISQLDLPSFKYNKVNNINYHIIVDEDMIVSALNKKVNIDG